MEDIKLNSNECVVSDVPITAFKSPFVDNVEFVSMQSFMRDMRQYLEKMDEKDEYLAPLKQLIDAFVSAKNTGADQDDFHNIAVDLARHSYKELAIDVLNCGLNHYPRNVDLLSDYILYGKDCEKWDECKVRFNTLLKIPMHRWSWRGFSFSIGYLIDLFDQKISEEEEKTNTRLMNEIAENFVKYFPNDENSRISMSDVHKFCGCIEQGVNVLKDALDKLKIATRCDLI